MRAKVWEHPGAALALALARLVVENLQEFLQPPAETHLSLGDRKSHHVCCATLLIHRMLPYPPRRCGVSWGHRGQSHIASPGQRAPQADPGGLLCLLTLFSTLLPEP